jgi:hypothetical protein
MQLDVPQGIPYRQATTDYPNNGLVAYYPVSAVATLKCSVNKAIAHAPFEGVKMGRCLGLYFFGCGDIANMSQPSGDTAA